MINFIIYEDEKKYRELYIAIILKIVGSTKLAYKIIEIDRYDKPTMKMLDKIEGKKIFLLDIEVPGKSGLDIARMIRKNNDWKSQLIVITTHEHMKNIAFTSRMLMLDFISKYYNCEENMKDCLTLAINILNEHQSLNFQYNGELYQIPYDDILFIEKNVDNCYSTIVTKKSKIELNKKIGTIEEELKDEPRFFRTHRSCIVNTYNITGVELRECKIKFGDISTNLLSRDKKCELKEAIDNKVVANC